MQIRFGDWLRWLTGTACVECCCVQSIFLSWPLVWKTAPASSILIKIHRSWRDPKCFFRSWGTQTSAFFVPSRFNCCETVVWAMLKRSTISRVVRYRSTLIAAKIWSLSMVNGRAEQAASANYISGTKARKPTLVSVSIYGRISVHVTYLTLCFRRF